MKRYLERIERTTRLDIGLGVDQGDLRETQREIARLTTNRNVQIGTELHRTSLRDTRNRIVQLTRDRRMRVNVDLDQGALARLRTTFAGRSFTGAGGAAGGLDSGGMSRYGKRILALSAAITALIPAVAGLTGALVQASGVLALLPALGLAGAAGMGVLALAFTNLSDAGAQFAHIRRELGRFTGEFKALQRSVQAEIFAGLAHPIRNLATNLFPIMQARLVGIAGAFNALAAAMVGFLNSSQSLADTDTGLANTEATLRALTPGIVAFSQAFRDIAAVGSTFLPALAGDLSAVGQRFAAFIADARDSGALEAFFTQSLDAFASLSTSIGNLGSALSGLITAQGPTGAFLANLELVTGAIASVINSAQGQAGLGALFSGIGGGFAALFANLGTFESLIASVGPVLGELFLQVGTVAGAFLDALAPALAILAPSITTLMSTVGGALAGALTALAPAFESIAAQLGPFLELLGTEFAGILEALAPVLGSVVSALGGAFLNALTLLTPIIADLLIALGPLVQTLGTALASALVTLAPYLAQIAQAFLDALLPAVAELVPQIPGLVQGIVDLLIAVIPLIPSILALAGQMLRLIPLWIRTAVEVLPKVITVVGFLSGVLSVVIGWITKVIQVAADFSNKFTSAGNQIRFTVAFIQGAFAAMGEKVQGAFRSMGEAVRGGVSRAAGFVSELPGKVTSALSGFGTLLKDKGRALIQGLIDGITARIQGIKDAMSKVTKAIGDFLPGSPIRTGPLRSWNNGGAGRRLIEMGIIDPLTGSRPAVDRAMRSLTGRIATPTMPGMAGGAGGPGGAGFPSQVTLVDANGSLLGVMDVRVGQAMHTAGRQLAGSF